MAEQAVHPYGRLHTLPGVVHRDCAERIVLVKKHVAEVSTANADRILKHGLEYRVQIIRGTADDLEEVRCGFLLFQRLAQFAAKPSNICLRFTIG